MKQPSSSANTAARRVKNLKLKRSKYSPQDQQLKEFEKEVLSVRSCPVPKMKKLSLFIIAWVCLGISGFAPVTLQADNIKDAYKVFSFFHGKWQQEIEIEGTKTIEHGKCEGSAGDCNIWISEKGTFIFGYDPKSKKWRGVGQLDGGSRMVREAPVPAVASIVKGTKLTFSQTIWHSDGTKTVETGTFTCLGPDSFHEAIKRKDQDGKKLPTITSISKRIK